MQTSWLPKASPSPCPTRRGHGEPPDPVPRTELADASAGLEGISVAIGDRTPAVFLDYDGTLTDSQAAPPGRRSNPRLLALLRDLTELSDATVAIISGRYQG